MITLSSPTEINIKTVTAVAFDGEKIALEPGILTQVDDGRKKFEQLIAAGVPCYGVTTGLGQLVNIQLSEEEQDDLPHNILRARAAAVGPPLPKTVVRALMMIKLVNFLSGLDGVSVALCQFLVDRLNDDFAPWIPSLGHGMAADATANTHAFQTFIGEGFVMGADGLKQPAAQALHDRGVAPLRLGRKEGLALLNGIGVSPAYFLYVLISLREILTLATTVAAVSVEGAAAPKDAFDDHLLPYTAEPGTAHVLSHMAHLLNNSLITPHKLQGSVSLRIIPQVHGALHSALEQVERHIEHAIQTFSDNPIMVATDQEEGRFLSIGAFHNQHLVNHAELLAIALAHVGTLSVRRLHRLLNPQQTGLNPQLAGRPGIDAGLVVAHKAAIGVAARLKHLAAPLSLFTDESSAGQEDYMSLAVPTIDRLLTMADLTRTILAYELLGGITALRQRPQQPGVALRPFVELFLDQIAPLDRDRSPGPDVELIIELFKSKEVRKVLPWTISPT